MLQNFQLLVYCFKLYKNVGRSKLTNDFNYPGAYLIYGKWFHIISFPFNNM